MDLIGKRVLFISPAFFEYPEMIKKEIEKQGAIIHWYDDRDDASSIEKIILRCNRSILKKKYNEYYEKIIHKEIDFCPDYVLFVNPEAVTKESLSMMKKNFNKCKFVLYMWDSIENKKILEIVDLFDKVFSFDKNDCKKYGFIFRPLFYSKIGVNKENLYKYDVGFIGTVHSDRALILKKIKDYCDENDLTYYFYLYVPSKLLLFLRLLTDRNLRLWKKQYVHTIPIDGDIFLAISRETRCTIDINHPKQTGLTMRTIELLGLKRKIITTNKNIEQYDFYRPENQIIVDRKNIQIDKKMLLSDYVDIDENIQANYSISTWVKDILCDF